MSKSTKKSDSKLKLNTCMICNKEYDSSLIRIKLESLTGKSNFHRECKIDTLDICPKCALELSNIVDKYIIKKNPSLRKFNDIY